MYVTRNWSRLDSGELPELLRSELKRCRGLPLLFLVFIGELPPPGDTVWKRKTQSIVQQPTSRQTPLFPTRPTLARVHPAATCSPPPSAMLATLLRTPLASSLPLPFHHPPSPSSPPAGHATATTARDLRPVATYGELHRHLLPSSSIPQ